MSKKITFTPLVNIDKDYYPSPAIKEVPEWYRNTPPYPHSKKYTPLTHGADMTIKKCIPVFDAMSMGYIIKTYCDIYVDSLNGYQNFYSPSYERVIDFHPAEQAQLYPNIEENRFPKFINQFAIETEKGYSCLIVPPMHRDNKYFSILPGVVDTDTFHGIINFPFTMTEKNFSGNIPAGTPIAQIIPFKRDSFKMNIGYDVDKVNKFRELLKIVWKDSYKNRFWNKKQYI